MFLTVCKYVHFTSYLIWLSNIFYENILNSQIEFIFGINILDLTVEYVFFTDLSQKSQPQPQVKQK